HPYLVSVSYATLRSCPTCYSFSYLFFFISPPPPRSTLFPYTTLFRSHIHSRPVRYRERRTARHGGGGARPHPEKAGCRNHFQGLDRKSTRLNSSHVSISYAVFCLKKKKQKQRNDEEVTQQKQTHAAGR